MFNPLRRRTSVAKKTCPYCGSDIKKMNEFQYYCGFCDMRVNSNRAMQNNERLEVRVREFVADHYIHKNTLELMNFSTYELLYILKFIRKERSDMYHHMKTFHRAGQQEETDQFEEIEKETGKNYIYLLLKISFASD
jgi:NADH:ubiquinone oxidoreductase subunit D